MSSVKKFILQVYRKLLSETAKEAGERIILSVAILSYIVHLTLILLVEYDFIHMHEGFSTNPIAAIYTPFSFILIYEVYLLIHHLPKSTTVYIGKQYEIICLIIIRRIFKDVANIEFSSDWFQIDGDLRFTFDIAASLLLFFLIFLFYRQIQQRTHTSETMQSKAGERIRYFIMLKKAIATLLVPLLFIVGTYSLLEWLYGVWSNYPQGVGGFEDINNVFFDEFFTILIIVDVLLLLISFYYSDRFHIIIRNSGFVISTILIKMSFAQQGIINVLLIVGAVVFGLGMLLIHNQFEQKSVDSTRNLSTFEEEDM